MKLHKACYNETCSSYKKQHKYIEEYSFCPMCASELSYVCNDKQCYNKLDNVLKKYCDECLIKQQERKDNRKETTAKVFKAVPTALTATLTVLTTGNEIKKILPKKNGK